MKTSDSIDKITKALVSFQADVENPKKDTEGYGYKYAPLETVLEAVKPALWEHDLAVSQSTTTEGEQVGVKTILWHDSGQFIEFDELTLPRDNGQQRSGAQAAGSSITYARRYALSAALGIASEEDTDAAGPNKSGNRKPRSNKGKSSNKRNKQSKSANATSMDGIKKAMQSVQEKQSEDADMVEGEDAQAFARFWQENISDDEGRYEFLSEVLGREVESTKEMTEPELNMLRQMAKGNQEKFIKVAKDFIEEGNNE